MQLDFAETGHLQRESAFRVAVRIRIQYESIRVRLKVVRVRVGLGLVLELQSELGQFREILRNFSV